jgi:hypothetical protein
MVTGATLQRLSQSRWVDEFLLRDAERAVASVPPTRFLEMRSLFKAAELRRRAADELFEGVMVASLALYREASVLYMAALSSARTGDALVEPLRPERVVETFRGLEKSRPAPCSDEELETFFRLLVDPDPLVLDRLTPSEVLARMKAIRAIVCWLRDLNEPRSVRYIRFLRVARLASLGAIVVGTIVWAASAAFAPKNIALHKPVTASSVHPSAVFAPNGLTDGVTSASYGIHTAKENAPWVQVDLTDIYRIKQVKIYNRGDGWYDDCLPLTLLFSENGTDFVPVEARTQSFGQWIPWTVEVKDRRARYVRVAGAAGNFVALNEIEVFGKK